MSDSQYESRVIIVDTAENAGKVKMFMLENNIGFESDVDSDRLGSISASMAWEASQEWQSSNAFC